MTMMFEVEDLAAASPATVSRCGMVYMEPGALGNGPLVKSWLNTLPETFAKKKTLIPTIEGLFTKYMEEMLRFVRKNCPEPVVTVDNNLVESLMRILDCYFSAYIEDEVKKVSAEQIEELETVVE
jgi:dynein heavy chain